MFYNMIQKFLQGVLLDDESPQYGTYNSTMVFKKERHLENKNRFPLRKGLCHNQQSIISDSLKISINLKRKNQT